jgi:hypothetical protein
MKRVRAIWVFVLIVLVLAVGLSAGACGAKEPATSTTGASSHSPTTATSTDGTTLTTGAGAGDGGLTGPYVEPAYLDSQPVDLAAIANLANAPLSDAQKQVLARLSFVAAVQDPVNGPWKFWHIYETARYQGLPVLVTTDSLLNAYHQLFNTLLQRAEEAALYDQAIAMTEALYAAASDQWNTATDSTVKEDARLNMAFFAVANSLLKGAVTAPDVVADEVGAELALIPSSVTPRTTANTNRAATIPAATSCRNTSRR